MSFISKSSEWSIKVIECYGCLVYNYILLQSVDKVSCVPHLFSGEIILAFPDTVRANTNGNAVNHKLDV